MRTAAEGATEEQLTLDVQRLQAQWEAISKKVEKGQAPDKVIAQARGAGNAAGANLELPASWSANRTRPLCAYPKVARYNGTGDIESASSFSCK